MNYSNGFDVSLVVPALTGRRGWRQPTLTGSPVLDTANKTCTSTRYFEDVHALVTVQNVHETQEDSAISNNDFNAYLLNKQKSVIMKALNTVFNEPEKLQQVQLYDKWERDNEQPIANSGLVKGVAFSIAKDFGISHQIPTVTLYFTEDVTFTLYAFKDGKKDHFWSKEVTANAWEKTDISIADLYLIYGQSKRFFLCYFQDDLGTAQAIKEEGCFNKTLCFQAMSFSGTKITGETNFDRVNYASNYDSNGINVEVISFRDHTQRIIRNPALFDEVIGLEMAVDVIEGLNYSTRSNINERITGEKSQQLFSEVNQAFGSQELPFVPGLKSKVTNEYKTLRKTFFPKPKAQTISLC